MASLNPFDLLGGDDNDDPSQLIAAAQQQKAAAAAAAAAATAGGGKKAPAAGAVPAAPAKMPTKPVPPTQAVREARNNSAPTRGNFGRGGPGRGRGGRGAGIDPNRDFGSGGENGFAGNYGAGGGSIAEEGEGGKPVDRNRGGYGPPRQSFRGGGGRRGGYNNADGEAGGDSERPPRRTYERRSGTGRGYEMKREGAGRGNWGTVTDEVAAQEVEENVNADEKVATIAKLPEQEAPKPEEGDKDNKEKATNEEEEKPEDKEMTLEEYEKIREEKRKALLALKTNEERRVVIDKELEAMQQLSVKKGNDDIFIKLGSDKESKRRENAEREERAKKSVSITEFLKPAEGEGYYNPGGRGRGRGRGDRGRGGYGGGRYNNTPAAPAIEDPGQFPTLGGK